MRRPRRTGAALPPSPPRSPCSSRWPTPPGWRPATFLCVFVGALGTSSTTIKEAALLALGITIFGVLLFSFALKVQFPVLRGVLS